MGLFGVLPVSGIIYILCCGTEETSLAAGGMQIRLFVCVCGVAGFLCMIGLSPPDECVGGLTIGDVISQNIHLVQATSSLIMTFSFEALIFLFPQPSHEVEAVD